MSRAEPLSAASVPAELPPEIHAMPGHLIRRMHQASQAVFDAEITAAGFDLTSVQFAALTVVEARPGLDQASLSTAIAFDRATTGGVVDRLEFKGLVRREISKVDRRARHLFIEPEGQTVLIGVRPVVDRVQGIILGGLNAAEKAAFLTLLEKALATIGDATRSDAKIDNRAAVQLRRAAK